MPKPKTRFWHQTTCRRSYLPQYQEIIIIKPSKVYKNKRYSTWRKIKLFTTTIMLLCQCTLCFPVHCTYICIHVHYRKVLFIVNKIFHFDTSCHVQHRIRSQAFHLGSNTTVATDNIGINKQNNTAHDNSMDWRQRAARMLSNLMARATANTSKTTADTASAKKIEPCSNDCIALVSIPTNLSYSCFR